MSYHIAPMPGVHHTIEPLHGVVYLRRKNGGIVVDLERSNAVIDNHATKHNSRKIIIHRNRRSKTVKRLLFSKKLIQRVFKIRNTRLKIRVIKNITLMLTKSKKSIILSLRPRMLAIHLAHKHLKTVESVYTKLPNHCYDALK